MRCRTLAQVLMTCCATALGTYMRERTHVLTAPDALPRLSQSHCRQLVAATMAEVCRQPSGALWQSLHSIGHSRRLHCCTADGDGAVQRAL